MIINSVGGASKTITNSYSATGQTMEVLGQISQYGYGLLSHLNDLPDTIIPLHHTGSYKTIVRPTIPIAQGARISSCVTKSNIIKRWVGLNTELHRRR